MAKNVVVCRVRPQLIRKRTVIKTVPTVRVVAKPAQQKVLKLQDIRPPSPPTPQNSAAVVQPKNVKRQRSIRKKTHVRYQTRDPLPGSLERTKAIQSLGRGKILIIIGNGPSISEAPLDQLVGIPHIEIMSVNRPDERIWPTTYWSFFDLSQMRRHEKLWENYEGYIFNSTAIRRQKAKSIQFKNIIGHGWSRDLTKGLHIGRSSVYASMQIAMWMQFAHVYIFGCDMNPDGINGQLHFYGVNPDVEPNIRAQRFLKESEFYVKAAEVLTEEERAKFTFATDYNPWDFVHKYNQMSHKSMGPILEHAASLTP